MIIFKFLIIWNTLFVTGADGIREGLAPNVAYYETKQEMLQVYDALTPEQKKAAIMFQGFRVNALDRYNLVPFVVAGSTCLFEVKPST